MNKRALLFGVSGQDGSYLAELLLEKGYDVHGVLRRASTENTQNIDHLLSHPAMHVHYGDLCDSLGVYGLIHEIKPDEIYNLAAQSHVGVSFEIPEYTADVDGVGALRILEGVRRADLCSHTRYYQASTSELFGQVAEIPQSEKTPFYPRSPYGVAKLYAYWITVNYRESYGMYACNGILFNHESPRRGVEFVTRKITRGLVRIYLGLQECLQLGNMSALRDWGHARDYVEMQWLMLQQTSPEDYVISSGEQHSVRDFVNCAARELGMILRWEGEGAAEVAFWIGSTDGCNQPRETSLPVISVNEKYYRPAEVETLLGNASKACSQLGWQPKTSFNELVAEMVQAELTAERARTQ